MIRRAGKRRSGPDWALREDPIDDGADEHERQTATSARASPNANGGRRSRLDYRSLLSRLHFTTQQMKFSQRAGIRADDARLHEEKDVLLPALRKWRSTID